jgi:hypothetical protein
MPSGIAAFSSFKEPTMPEYVEISALEKGKRYTVSYIPDGCRNPREFTAQFLGKDQRSPWILVWDLRPQHGTADVDERQVEWIIAVYERDENAVQYRERPSRRSK